MKIDIIKKDHFAEIVGTARLITDVHNSGWRVEVYAADDVVSVLVTGAGGDFECAQLASAFHSSYKHLFNPDHKVNFYRVPIGYSRKTANEELSDAPLWTRIIEKSCSTIALTVAYVKSLAL